MYVLTDCIFRDDHISLHKLDLTYICVTIPNYYYMYYCSDSFCTLYVVIYGQVLCPLWWIAGILNKLL